MHAYVHALYLCLYAHAHARTHARTHTRTHTHTHTHTHIECTGRRTAGQAHKVHRSSSGAPLARVHVRVRHRHDEDRVSCFFLQFSVSWHARFRSRRPCNFAACHISPMILSWQHMRQVATCSPPVITPSLMEISELQVGQRPTAPPRPCWTMTSMHRLQNCTCPCSERCTMSHVSSFRRAFGRTARGAWRATAASPGAPFTVH